MKKLLLTLLLILTTAGMANAFDKYTINRDELPQKAQDFISEFSNSGKWTEVDCKSREVPQGIIMKPIRNYVAKTFSDVKIVKIEKKSSGYEVKLSDGVELKFNLVGQFKSVKMDD